MLGRRDHDRSEWASSYSGGSLCELVFVYIYARNVSLRSCVLVLRGLQGPLMVSLMYIRCCAVSLLNSVSSQVVISWTVHVKVQGSPSCNCTAQPPVTVARQSHKPLRVEGSTWTVRPWNVSTSGVLDQSVNVIGLFSPSIMHPLHLGRPIPAEYSYH